MQPLNCQCRTAAKCVQVKKEGPNQGKWFWTCARNACKFFAWHTGPPPPPGGYQPIPSSPALSNGGASTAGGSNPQVTPRPGGAPGVFLQVKCEMVMNVLEGDGNNTLTRDAISYTYPTACALAGAVTAVFLKPEFRAVNVGPGKYYIPLVPFQLSGFVNRALEMIPRQGNSKLEVVYIPRHVVDIITKLPVLVEEKPFERPILPSLWEKLMPFQRQAIQFAIDRYGRVLIGDEMGLGKTIQAIAIANYYQNEWPLLVFCPCSLIFTWRSEILKWLPFLETDQVIVFSSNGKAQRITSGSRVFLVPYTLASNREQMLKNLSFKVVICDESHYLKEPKTKRTQAVSNIVRQAKRIILLSGTALLARPAELYPQLQMILPGFVKSFHEFGNRYCGPTRGFNGATDYTGNSNLNELAWFLRRTVMVRRKKADVLKDLPAKTRQEITIEVTDQEKAQMKNVLKQLAASRDAENGSAPSNPSFLELHHTSSKAKSPGVCEYVSTLMEGEEKFLVFAHFKEMLNNLELAVKRVCDHHKNENWDYIRIDGSTPQDRRQELVEKFRSEETCKVAVLSMRAAGTGLTFTPCSTVVFAELDWTPALLTQCEDRVHRMGQLNCCTAQYLLAPGTIDEILWPSLQKKFEVCTTLLDDSNSTLEMNTRTEFTRNEDFQNVVQFKPPTPPPPEPVRGPMDKFVVRKRLHEDDGIICIDDNGTEFLDGPRTPPQPQCLAETTVNVAAHTEPKRNFLSVASPLVPVAASGPPPRATATDGLKAMGTFVFGARKV